MHWMILRVGPAGLFSGAFGFPELRPVAAEPLWEAGSQWQAAATANDNWAADQPEGRGAAAGPRSRRSTPARGRVRSGQLQVGAPRHLGWSLDAANAGGSRIRYLA